MDSPVSTKVEVKTEAQPNSSKVDADSTKMTETKEPENDAQRLDTNRSSVVTQPEKSSGSGFFPMVLGGLVAGGIGYGIAYYQFGQQQVTADDLAAVRDSIPAPAEPTDLSGIEAGLAALRTTDEALSGDVAALQERLDSLEMQPTADGGLPQAAIDAFEAEMSELRLQVEAQQDELQAMADQAAAQLETTRNEALRIEESAVEAARNATAKAALARIQAALESGAPFASVLSELEAALGEPAPADLRAVSDGTITLGTLQSTFPAAARQALTDARSEGVDGEVSGGFGAFLRDQLNARSVTPQDGDSVDATLSRAEAALREGRLNDTLAEIAALPDVARAALSDWLAEAEARAAAIDAAETLSGTLTSN